MKRRKPRLCVAKDLEIARSRQAMASCTVAEIETIRRQCYLYLAASEARPCGANGRSDG